MVIVSTQTPRGGELDRTLSEQLTKVAGFCIKELKLTRFNAILNIIVSKRKGYLSGGVGGYCCAWKEELGHHGKVWNVDIELAHVGRGEMMSTLCHEMIHAKQYLRKELSADGDKWKGKTFKVGPRDVFALKSPWEKEAYKLEEKIFKKLTTHVDFNWIKRYNINF